MWRGRRYGKGNFDCKKPNNKIKKKKKNKKTENKELGLKSHMDVAGQETWKGELGLQKAQQQKQNKKKTKQRIRRQRHMDVAGQAT